MLAPRGARPSQDTAKEILNTDLNLSDALRKRNWTEFDQVLRDCSQDAGGEMLGTGVKPDGYQNESTATLWLTCPAILLQALG